MGNCMCWSGWPHMICNWKGDQQHMCMTMINPATSWFEIVQVPIDDKSLAHISQIFNNSWLSHYPWPVYCVYNNGGEFKLHFKTLCAEYSIQMKPTSIKNLQANSVLEHVHQVVGNMLCSQLMDDQEEWDAHDPFGEILSGIAWAIHSSYHTMLGAMPGQIIYGQDMVFDVPFFMTWNRLIYVSKNKLT